MVDTVDITCGVIVIVVILVSIGLVQLGEYSQEEFLKKPLEEQCNNRYDIYENGNTVITYYTSCVKYFTDEKGYVVDKVNDPSFGLTSYILKMGNGNKTTDK